MCLSQWTRRLLRDWPPLTWPPKPRPLLGLHSPPTRLIATTPPIPLPEMAILRSEFLQFSLNFELSGICYC